MQHHWLEYISWIANGVLAIVAIIALVQVGAAIQQAKSSLAQTKLLLEQVEVSRQDIMLRSRREALALALEQCKRFAEAIIPHLDKVHTQLKQRNYQPPKDADPEFPFIPLDAVVTQIWQTLPLRNDIINVLNEAESFAMYFACDLADEQVAFTPTAQTFCQNCEYYAPFIGLFRQKDRAKLYQNLISLYGKWKPRLDRTILDEQTKALEQKKKRLPPDKPGTPLGTSFG